MPRPSRSLARLALLGLSLVWLLGAPWGALAVHTVPIAWNAPTTYTDASAVLPGDIHGYVVSYGTSSGVYTVALDVGLVTQTTLTGLSDSAVYYVVVTAYDATHQESISSTPELILAGCPATIAWTAPTTYTDASAVGPGDIHGYVVLYGTSSGIYTVTLDVGLVTQTTLPSLPAPALYYVAATAYDAIHQESAPSTPELILAGCPSAPGPQGPTVRRLGH